MCKTLHKRNRKQLMRSFLSVLLALTMGIGIYGCSDKNDETETNASSLESQEYIESNEPDGVEIRSDTSSGLGPRRNDSTYASDSDETWAIYWYLCGSDLERRWGCATNDLLEMTEVNLPDNIQVIILAGGTTFWQNDVLDPDVLSLCVYDSDGFELVDTYSQTNMGDPDTLLWFLSYCRYYYPADREAVIIWNHGGGSISGVACDENYGMDALSLYDLWYAFSELDANFELVGFDACLMASIDTAAMLYQYADWMVASQENEPGIGWNYKGLFEGLAADPGMHGGELGRIICDTYYQDCVNAGQYEDVTLSVIDLNEIGALLAAFDYVGIEALSQVSASPSFFSEFGRAARSAENYGGNNRSEGYSNMVDIGDLVRQAGDLLPQSGRPLQRALEAAVYYKVNGPYRSQSSGISCYYSYDSDYDNYSVFASLGTSQAFAYYYAYELTGWPGEGMYDYLSATQDWYWDEWADWDDWDDWDYWDDNDWESFEWGEPSYFDAPDSFDFEDYPIDIWYGDTAVLDLGPELADQLVAVYFNIAIFDLDSEVCIFLGMDDDIYADWEDGLFMDNFVGEWCAIDGALVYMDVSDETDEYIFYAIPILLNGEEHTLSVVYDYYEDEYLILGARSGIDEYGMASKNLRKLAVGDVVEPLLYVWFDIEDSDDIQIMAFESITVTSRTSIEKVYMGDGFYLFLYEMWDYRGNSYLSELMFFIIEDGEIYLEG